VFDKTESDVSFIPFTPHCSTLIVTLLIEYIRSGDRYARTGNQSGGFVVCQGRFFLILFVIWLLMCFVDGEDHIDLRDS
jgi:hypothetical protein